MSPFTTSSTGTAAPAHPLLATAGIEILEARRRAFLTANIVAATQESVHLWLIRAKQKQTKPKLGPVRVKSRRLPFPLIWLLADLRLPWLPAALCWSLCAFSSSFGSMVGCSHDAGRLCRHLPLWRGHCVAQSRSDVWKLYIIQHCLPCKANNAVQRF